MLSTSPFKTILKNKTTNGYFIHFASIWWDRRSPEIQFSMLWIYHLEKDNLEETRIFLRDKWEKEMLEQFIQFLWSIIFHKNYKSNPTKLFFVEYKNSRNAILGINGIFERYKTLTQKDFITIRKKNITFSELKRYIFSRCYFLKDEIERNYPNIKKTTFHIENIFDVNHLNIAFIKKGSEEACINLKDKNQYQTLCHSFSEKMASFWKIIERIKNESFIPPYQTENKFWFTFKKCLKVFYPMWNYLFGWK